MTENSENTNYFLRKLFDSFFSSLFINIALRTINLGLESLFIKKKKKEKIYEFNFLMNEFYKRYRNGKLIKPIDLSMCT
jgi:hypothetical protein